MSRNTLTRFCVVLILLIFPLHLFAQRIGNIGGTAQAVEITRTATPAQGGIVTLYALDPLTRTFCFFDGKDGSVFQHNEVRNRCSDVDFNHFHAGSFTVGVDGGSVGRIVDLGNATELKQRYGYEETVGNGQGFASLRIENGKLVILRDRRSQAVQELKESVFLLQERADVGPTTSPQSAASATATIRLGNIYLVRLTDPDDKTLVRVVKLMVIAYVPNESVTIRWQVL